jgi:hypothetical protein
MPPILRDTGTLTHFPCLRTNGHIVILRYKTVPADGARVPVVHETEIDETGLVFVFDVFWDGVLSHLLEVKCNLTFGRT